MHLKIKNLVLPWLIGVSSLMVSCSQEAQPVIKNAPQAQEPVLRRGYPTEVRMHGLWDTAAFASITDKASWEKVFLDDDILAKHIQAGQFIPIYIHENGIPVIELRIAGNGKKNELSKKEQSWLKAKSEPYLFISNGKVEVSGVEYVNPENDDQTDRESIALSPGRYTAVVYQLAYPENVFDPVTDYPPNFIVMLELEKQPAPVYRQNVQTFTEQAKPN